MMEEELTGSFKKYLVNDGNATKNGLETFDGKVCLVLSVCALDLTVHRRGSVSYRSSR